MHMKIRKSRVNEAVLANLHQEQAAKHLCALQRAMQTTDMVTRYQPPETSVPKLDVTNPASSRLSETIYAAPRQRGGAQTEWWFWWSWGDRICVVEQLDEASRRIASLLRGTSS